MAQIKSTLATQAIVEMDQEFIKLVSIREPGSVTIWYDLLIGVPTQNREIVKIHVRTCDIKWFSPIVDGYYKC